MFKYIIKNDNEVRFSSEPVYNTSDEAKEIGFNHLDAWETIHNEYGTIEVIEEDN